MKILTTMCALAFSINIFANGINSLVIWKTNGERINILLNENPKVTFTENEMTITTKMNKVSFSATDVIRFTYEDIPTGINNVAKGNDAMFSIEDEYLNLSNLSQSSLIHIYRTDGTLLSTAKANSNGSAKINIANFASGIYIVKTSVGNFKIHKP